MDQMVCAYTFISPRSDQFLVDVDRRAAAVEWASLQPLSRAPAAAGVILEHSRCRAELFRHVIKI